MQRSYRSSFAAAAAAVAAVAATAAAAAAAARRSSIAALIGTACLSWQAAAAPPQPYVPESGTCGGYPRVGVVMAPGLCMGLVYAPPDGFRGRSIKTPRMLLPLEDDRHWLLMDLGAWTDKLGKVWMLEIEPTNRVHVRQLVGGLALPHTIATGPDGAIYVAEMNRIFRLSRADGSASTVIAGLPGNRLHIGRHPLSHFVFDANGDFLVNVGADTDQCADDRGVPLGARCPEAEGNDARAVIRRYPYLGSGRWQATPTILASGLRNSLVLVRHASGTLVQGENSYDFAPSEERPYDEINVLHTGGFYGWPYCYDSARSTPAWAGTNALDCSSAAHEKPALMLPPHAAPLGALYYSGAAFPALRGKLLMTWHGYRPTGSRIVAFDVDARGVPVTSPHPRYPEYRNGQVVLTDYRDGPAAEPLVLTPGWDLVPGSHPAGAPVALTVAHDGTLWITDDRNASILRIAPDAP